MNKCDFCSYSKLGRDGKLYCPYRFCILTKSELENMLRILANGRGK